MPPPRTDPLPFDATVRVGCALTYEAAAPALLLLNVRPRANRHHAIIAEGFSLGDNLAGEEFTDSHGNLITRVKLAKGMTSFRHDALVRISTRPENHGAADRSAVLPADLPPEFLRYTLPSRYCDSDKLNDFAWEKFGGVEAGWPRVQAISQWLHENIEYRFLSGRPDLSAWDVLQRGYGVCRDFAHLAVALNRCFNVPARYVSGHLPDIGFIDPGTPMDFHAYAEVYLGGQWHITDARFHVPRIGRIKVACGQDAADAAFSTIYGAAQLTYFEVWAYQVAPGTVGVGDPVDLALRIDGVEAIRADL